MAFNRKRTFDDMEGWNVSEVREREKAVVHGVDMHVSPVKTSRTNAKRKYFDGRIGDGKKVVRVVGFNPSLRGKLEGLREEGKAVCIANCVVKGEERNNEILINSKTTVTQSPRKFTVIADSDEVTQLTDIGNLSTGQQVTVRVKVVTVGSTEAVKGELQKQECVVGDVSGCCHVVLWNDDIGKLLEEKSYKLSYVSVKRWDGVKYLSVSEGSEIVCVDDIGDVAEIECGDEDSIVACHVVEGETDAVEYCDEYVECIGCKSKVHSSDGIVGECKKCGMLMKMKRGAKSVVAKVFVWDGGKMNSVTLFDSVLREIVCDVSGDCLKKRLLAAPPVQLKLDRQEVAVSVKKLLSSEATDNN